MITHLFTNRHNFAWTQFVDTSHKKAATWLKNMPMQCSKMYIHLETYLILCLIIMNRFLISVEIHPEGKFR